MILYRTAHAECVAYKSPGEIKAHESSAFRNAVALPPSNRAKRGDNAAFDTLSADV